jgi:hypothetical protein
MVPVNTNLPLLDWEQKKPQFLPAYKAMADSDFGKKDPQIDVMSFNVRAEQQLVAEIATRPRVRLRG